MRSSVGVLCDLENYVSYSRDATLEAVSKAQMAFEGKAFREFITERTR